MTIFIHILYFCRLHLSSRTISAGQSTKRSYNILVKKLHVKT